MKQKILILAAIPHGLRLDREIREIEEAIRRATRRDLFEVRIRTAVRPQDIRRAIAEERPEIVHFCGHGMADGSLVLEDDGGNNKPVSPEGLATLFKLHADYVNCVLLNACHSAKPAEVISQHINYAIGMNQEIKDGAAIAFAQGFYDALGYEAQNNQDVFQRAFDEGLVAIQLEDLSEGQIPVLKKKMRGQTIVQANLQVSPPSRSNSNILIGSSIATVLIVVGTIFAFLHRPSNPPPEPEISFNDGLTKIPLECTGDKKKDEEKSKRLLKSGKDKLDKNSHKEAIKDLTQAICFATDDYLLFQAYTRRGQAKYKSQEYQRAITDYQQAINHNHSSTENPRENTWNAELFQAIGDAYSQSGEKQKAINNYQQALKLYRHPDRINESETALVYLKQKIDNLQHDDAMQNLKNIQP